MSSSAAIGATGHPDRVLFSTDVVAIGQFRCDATHPLFRDSGPIRQPCFVFPRTAVAIAHDGHPPFVADPSILTLYNGGQRYERRPISPDGDRCDWFAVTPAILRDAIRSFDAAAADEPDEVLQHQHAPSPASLYWRQRRLLASVRDGEALSALEVEEAVCSLLHDVLGQAYGGAPKQKKKTASTGDRRRVALVDAARRFVAVHFAEAFTLSDLAAGLGCSPFHLCRAFHAATGLTLHAYRHELRLRASLERIESGTGLTGVALDLGYSSHSHFTESFRRAFGVPPSRASAAGLRKNPIARGPAAGSRSSA